MPRASAESGTQISPITQISQILLDLRNLRNLRNLRFPRAASRAAAGFTLTELIVVIGIIIVLTSTAVPALQAFRNAQKLDHNTRIVQQALSEARRRAITKRARHVVVLYSYEDRTEQENTLGRIRHALRIYCEPIGDPPQKDSGVYVDKPIVLAPGVRFAQEKMKFVHVFGPVSDPSEPLPLDSEHFGKGPGARAIGFRRDGTLDYDPSVDMPAVHPEVGVNIYLPDERYYQVPDGWQADIVVVETDSQGREVVRRGKKRRGFIDLEPRTGRATSRIFEIGAKAETELP